MMRRILLVAVMTGAMASAWPASAEEKKNQKVDIEADKMEVLDAEKKAIFTGKVHLVREDVTLDSDTLVVDFAEVKQADGSTKSDATNLDAKGNVLIKTRKETITGDWAIFKPQTNKLIVGGNVKLVQGGTVLTGNELHADLNTDNMQMKGGRVKGSFLPKQ